MKNKLISIIIPVYNVEEYLPRCLNSVRNQTYQNLEIILVNDGSTDNSGKICDEYAQKEQRIKVLHKINGGISSARNSGINIAKGEYITFLDSDDWIDIEYIKELYSILIHNSAQMSACKFCKALDIKSERKVFASQVEIITDNHKYYCALSEDSYVGFVCGKLFEKKTILANNIFFNEKIFNGEDMIFTIEYLKYIEKVAFIRDDLYFYFHNPKGMTYSKFSLKTMTVIDAREHALAFITQHAPEYKDFVFSSLISHLTKCQYHLYPSRDIYHEKYMEVLQKLKKYKKHILSLQGVSYKNKLKLFIMAHFNFIVGHIYRRIK